MFQTVQVKINQEMDALFGERAIGRCDAYCTTPNAVGVDEAHFTVLIKRPIEDKFVRTIVDALQDLGLRDFHIVHVLHGPSHDDNVTHLGEGNFCELECSISLEVLQVVLNKAA